MSDNAGGRRVAVQADDPATELFLINGRFEMIGRGLGRLEMTVAPGLYKVKARVGQSSREAYIRVQPQESAAVGQTRLRIAKEAGDVVVVNVPRLPFPSAAPLVGTSRTHEYHMAAAEHISAGPAGRSLGAEGELFVFGRFWRGPATQALAMHPLEGVSLAGPDGELVDFEREAKADRSEADPWSGHKVALPAGVYALRRRYGEAVFEQSVVVAKGWQTQVFLLHVHGEPSLATTQVAIFMRRVGEGFKANDPGHRWTEVALDGLEAGRLTVPEWVLDEMVRGKFDAPMLGLCASQYLAVQARVQANAPNPVYERQAQLLRGIVEHLREQIGLQADVAALAMRLGYPTQVLRLPDPPMLSLSWGAIVEASVGNWDLVPEGSRAARIAGDLWHGGAWLLWRRHEEPAKKMEEPPAAALESVAADGAGAAEIAAPGPAEAPELNALEAALYDEYMQRRLTRQAASTPEAAKPASYSPQLARRLRAPAPSLEAAAKSLAQKVKMEPPTVA